MTNKGNYVLPKTSQMQVLSFRREIWPPRDRPFPIRMVSVYMIWVGAIERLKLRVTSGTTFFL